MARRVCRVPSGLARIPLWKREIPKYPLFYKGDAQRKVLLPLFWMKVVDPDEKIPDNYVHFIVHSQMSKNDIKHYLEKIYKVPVLSVRTEIRMKPIQANMVKNGYYTSGEATIWKEDEKFAYVQLMPSETFKYPTFFKDGKKTDDFAAREGIQKESLKKKSMISTMSGLPGWFSNSKG